MFRFSIEDEKLLVSYMPERGVDWIFDVLKKSDVCNSKNTFYITKDVLLDDFSDYVSDEIQFVLGVEDSNYIKLDKNVLNIDYDIYFDINIKM